MLESLKRTITNWLTPDQLYAKVFSNRNPSCIVDPEQALTLSAFLAGVRIFENSLGSLPLIVYRRTEEGGRERARDLPEYRILHDQPNPAQTRSVFVRLIARRLILEGEFFALVRRTLQGDLIGLYPIDQSEILEVKIDDDWNKSVVLVDGQVLQNEEFCHCMINSADGIKGCGILQYASEALGLHKQVQTSANSYYQNAAQPSVYARVAPGVSPENAKKQKEDFDNNFTGAKRRGKTPFLSGIELEKFPGENASDAELIEALNLSVADIGRWLGLSPIQLGDFSAAHYATLAADNVAAFQKSYAPLIDLIESELNAKIFGVDENVYCEFLVESILRGDPLTQAQVNQVYLTSGVILRNEVRETTLNLPKLDGLDVPLHPLNQGAGSIENTVVQEGVSNT